MQHPKKHGKYNTIILNGTTFATCGQKHHPVKGSRTRTIPSVYKELNAHR